MEIYEAYFHKPHYEPPKKKHAPVAHEEAAPDDTEPAAETTANR